MVAEWIIWLLEDPVKYGFITWFLGVLLGLALGRCTKTHKLEIERDIAIAEKNIVLDAYEMLKKD